MAREPHYFKIGLFLLISVIASISAIIWLGAVKYFQPQVRYVTYIDESVQGLDKGTAVRYRGMTIGSVEDIRIAPDGKLVEVVMSADPKVKIEAKTMRVHLAMAGITGMRFLDIDYPSGTPTPALELSFTPPHPVLIAQLSTMKELFQSVETVYRRLMKLDLEGIVENLNSSLKGISTLINQQRMDTILANVEKTTAGMATLMNEERMERVVAHIEGISGKLEQTTEYLERFLAKPEIDRILENADKTVAHVEKLTEEVRQQVAQMELEKLEQNVRLTTEKLGQLAERFGKTTAEADTTLQSLRQNMNAIEAHLQKASRAFTNTLRSVERLADFLERDPASLLRGKQVSK